MSLTGLIAGSVAPDFEFLLRLHNTANFGHTWLGFFVCDIPFAVVLSFVFHYIIRDTLILHLPKYFRRRFSGLLRFNWWQYLKQHKFNFLIAVFTGILSHFFLDSFTHQNITIEQWFPFFSKEIIILNKPLPVYVLLQILTSLLGGLYILWFIIKMKKGDDFKSGKSISGYWIGLCIVTIAVFAVRLVADNVHQSTADIIIAATGSVVYALIVISLYTYKSSRQ